jgi:hypothetical protein
MQRHIWENLGTETKGGILDIHRGGKTHSYLCWPTVKLKTSHAELSKLQRMACLGITGAMRTAPTAAMEVLLGLPPVHLQVEAKAKIGNYRLRCNKQWKPKTEGFGHADITQNMEKEPILQMGSDKMIPRHVYDKPFTIRFPGRSE